MRGLFRTGLGDELARHQTRVGAGTPLPASRPALRRSGPILDGRGELPGGSAAALPPQTPCLACAWRLARRDGSFA
jgi:hypothetical protein